MLARCHRGMQLTSKPTMDQIVSAPYIYIYLPGICRWYLDGLRMVRPVLKLYFCY